VGRRSVLGYTVISDAACRCGDWKAFLRRTNRNLEQDERSDLLHHLHEKQRRHERYMRSASIFSPSASHVGSSENIDRELRIFSIALWLL